jgi:hypothetical protein
VRVAYAGGLGTYELLWADKVLFTTAALDALEGSAPEAKDEGSAPEAKDEGSAPEAKEAGSDEVAS